MTTLALAAGHTAGQRSHPAHKHFRHHPECRTIRCARHADQLYIEHRIKDRQRRELEHPPMGALEACIIHNESGGNPQAVSGTHYGIGQWLVSTWVEDGGGRFASTPLGASYAQQEIILRGEGEAGMRQQQAQYDGC